MKTILLSGPPRSGKDTLASVISEEVSFPIRERAISEEIRKAAHHLYSYLGRNPYAETWRFERTKDQPSAHFFGRTPRECYIAVADMVRALHGPDYWARLLVSDMQRFSRDYLTVVTDVGSDAQAEAFCRLGRPLVVSVVRPGTDWDNRLPVQPDPTRWDHMTYRSTAAISEIRLWVRKHILGWVARED